MFRKRRWLIIGGLILAQVGVIACYQGFLRGSSGPSAAPGCRAAEQPQTVQPVPPAEAPTPSRPLVHIPAAPADGSPAPAPTLVDAMPAPPVPEPQALTEPAVPVPAPEAAMSADAPPLPPAAPAPSPEPTPTPYVPVPVTPAPTAAPDDVPQVPIPVVPTPTPPAAVPQPQYQPMPVTVPDAPQPPIGPPPLDQTAPPPPQAQTSPPPLAPCPWTLKMTIVEGLTVMEARIGKEIQFRIVCEKLDLQAPRGSINAQGDVKISGSGLDGHCQKLLINWQDDHILVEGDAYLRCLRDGHDVELSAERLSLRLSESSMVKGVGKAKAAPGEEASEPREPVRAPAKRPTPNRAE